MATVFTSWKEIAQYLDKGVRTAQRWEQEEGLPVRRLDGEGSGKVLAFADEIDLWKHSATTQNGDQSERSRLLARVEQLLAENEDLRGKLNAVPEASCRPTKVLGGSESLFLQCTLLLADNARNRRRLAELIETHSSLTQASTEIINALKTFHPFRPGVFPSSRSTR